MALQTTGLEFFYLSVDFFENDKILLVEQELGSRATLLVLRLLARIYHKGYFCRWGKDECLLFTRRLPEGCTADYVQQVVDALLERGFFSKVQYERFGILTSESIQGHYFEAAQRRKRVEVRADYLLIEISKYKNLYVDGSNVGISTENVDMKTGNVNMKSQSKAEESKAEQKNEKDSSSFCSPEKKRIFAEKETFSSIPVDGKRRNTSGLVEALQQWGIGDDNLYKIVGYCDYGVIGHPIWQILADMRMSGGRLYQLLAFIGARLRV